MVLSSARRLLADLAPLAEHLNQSTDAFTDQITAIQGELIDLSAGIEVELDYPLGDGDLDGSYLAFRRGGAGWAFYVRRRQFDGEWEETPLLSASRDLRIAAAGQIDEVVRRIAADVKQKVSVLNKVIDESPLPGEWSPYLMGTDDGGLVHVLGIGTEPKPDAEALCGAHIATLFRGDRGRPCPRCLRLEEAGRDDTPF